MIPNEGTHQEIQTPILLGSQRNNDSHIQRELGPRVNDGYFAHKKQVQ